EPLSNRTCGFPAYGLPMVFTFSMHASRIPYGAQQLMQAMLVHETTVRPLPSVKRASAGFPAPLSAALLQQPHQPLSHVAIHRVELARRIARFEVVAPATQNRVEFSDHFSDIPHSRAATTASQVVNPAADRLHRPWAGPAEQIVALLEDRAHDPQVTAQELKAFLARTHLHQSGLRG